MNRQFTIRLLLSSMTLLGLFCQASADELKLASIFGDHMVLQRDMDLKFWGTANPGAEVRVELKGQTLSATAAENGKWMVTAKPISVGVAFEVVVRCGDETQTLKNCVAGDVWICSGQSNMEWLLRNTTNAEAAVKAADLPMIRHFDVDNVTAFTEEDSLSGSGWQVCTPVTSPNFTAVGFYFAKELNAKLDVPIGLINTSWGGTIIEAWTSTASLETHPDFTDRLKEMRESTQDKTKAAQRAKKFQAWKAKVNVALGDESEQWQDISIDDSSWKEASVPGYWEGQGFNDYDGAFWYRRSATVPDSWVGIDLVLNLGKIDDGDKTYVNGTLVGETDSWSAERVYPVDGELVKNKTLQVAVRVTDSNLGGGICAGEPFLSRKDGQGGKITLGGKWRIKPTSKTIESGPQPPVAFAGPNQPTVLYNAMVNPLIPMSFRGAIWYQGESNAGRAHQYQTLFPLLIKDWRAKWKRDFPFYWVQLANYQAPATKPSPSNWAELREAQSMTLKLPNTGQAIIIDVGEADDIHPRDKSTVGSRLAKIALANEYGGEEEFSGPVYKSLSVSGNVATVTFDHADSMAAVGGPPKRFELAGEDQKFHFAEAKIVDNTVVVTCDSVPNPVAVRYAWAHNPEGCNLYNSAGLPASPFRTDSWKGVTEGNR